MNSEGREPVRDWLKELPRVERRIIGEDIKTVQGLRQWRKPLVEYLGDGVWEVRATLPNTIARVLFAELGGEMILLHGFKKKTQKTPLDELTLAKRRKKNYETNQ
jgi:phage-related protein